MKLKRTTSMLRVSGQNRARKNSSPASTRIRRKYVDLALTTRTMGDVAVVQCGGKLIFQSEASALCEAVTKLVGKYRSIILDLNEVASIDGGGIGILVDCIRNARSAGTQLMLCRVPEKVRLLLDITRVSSLVDIATSERDALERSRAAA
jgi:anti-sigma B factor antagonist